MLSGERRPSQLIMADVKIFPIRLDSVADPSLRTSHNIIQTVSLLVPDPVVLLHQRIAENMFLFASQVSISVSLHKSPPNLHERVRDKLLTSYFETLVL